MGRPLILSDNISGFIPITRNEIKKYRNKKIYYTDTDEYETKLKEVRQERKKEIQQNNKLQEYKKYCEICNSYIRKDGFNHHIKTKKHLSNL